LAGKAHFLAEEYRRNNIGGIRKLLKVVQQVEVKCFIFFSSVKDVAGTVLLAAEMPEVANVSDGQNYSTRKFYDWTMVVLKFLLLLSGPVGLMRVLAKVGDGIGFSRGRRFFLGLYALDKLIASAWYSSAKIECELGFKPTHDLPRTLFRNCVLLGV
jgi:hypothetical protein